MSHNEQPRQDQSRRTLGVRPGFESRKPRKPFVAKGHDATLKDVQDNEAIWS